MTRSRVMLTLSAMGLWAGCTGTIQDGEAYGKAEDSIARYADDALDQTFDSDNSDDWNSKNSQTTDAGYSDSQPDEAYDPEPDQTVTTPKRATAAATTKVTKASEPAVTTVSASASDKTGAVEVSADAQALAASMDASVVQGPAPQLPIPGAAFTMIKNWDFGSNGNIRNKADLTKEFSFHDHFGTIANGTNYGAVTVAADEESAITAPGLGLPNDRQPVEDPTRPTREWNSDGMIAHVRPLSPSQTTVSASRHDAGNGSITSKWKLHKGGELLGHDLVWETRVRMPVQTLGYWFALWTAGEQWAHGAEMDVLESFGTPYVTGNAFHADSVGGVNTIDYVKNWFTALDQVGVPLANRALSEWHTFTWVYLKDDSFDIYYDGVRVQHGTIHWTYGGESGAEPVDMYFLFDFSWGHTTVNDVNIEVPAQGFDLQYEVDYSRVYVR